MLGIIIGVIAAAILVYFAFFSGGESPEPEIRDEAAGTSTVDATVAGKRVEQGGRKGGYFFVYYVGFDCEDGEYRELVTGQNVYDAVEVGERDMLIYSGSRFVGFGDHGSIEDGTECGEDDFTYDDYDESIDVERELETSAEPRASSGDSELFEMFRNRKMLPGQTATVEDEAEAFSGYNALALLKKAEIYPFLKREPDLGRVVERTFKEAMDDLMGYGGDSRQGRSADSVRINKNEVRVAITLRENQKPLKGVVTAEFGIND